MSAEFLQDLAKLFANSHGNTLKCAYAETFTHLLHPVIETATAEVNHPLWSKVIAVVLQRALGMATKPRYWSVAFPLVVVTLAVSPREIFMEHWQSCIDVIAAKSKDRQLRVIAMNSFVRLLWVYLNRCPESSTSTRKRLEGLLRNHFPQNSSQLLPADLPHEPFVAILHYVMVRQFDYGTELVGEFLRDAVPAHRSPGGASEILHSERAYVAVRAATHSLRCIANERPVMFPSSADFSRFEFDHFEASVLDQQPISDIPEADEFIQNCGPMTINVLLSCDRTVGNVLLSSDVVTLSVHASSASMESSGDLVTRKHGDIHVAFPARYEPPFRLMTALLDALPSLIPVATNISTLINILCRATFSADPTTCEVASHTMRRLAEDPGLCQILVDNYRQFVFESRNVFRDHFVGTRLLDSQLVRVVTLWVDVLGTMSGHQRTNENPEPVEADFVEKVEATGMFLLASNSVHLRRLAHQVFTSASDLIGQGREPSAPFRYSRALLDTPTIGAVLQMYESIVSDVDFSALSRLPTLSRNDRHRLDSFKGTKLIRKIAESDSPKDAALWAAILPAFVGKVNDKLPNPVKDLQYMVAQTVVRLQAHVSAIVSAKPIRAGPAANRSTSDAALLADQWRMYLSILCSTVDGSHVTPSSRKDQPLSAEMLVTPQVFQYLVQLLAWEDQRFQDAAVYALGSIRQSSLRSLSETLVNFVRRLADTYKSAANSRRPSAQSIMWTAAGHVFRLISPLILEGRSQAHIASLSSLIQFVKITLSLLADPQYREDYDLQSLRRWFCIVVDNLCTALGQLDSSDRFLGEEVRGAIFKLCYDWCHVGRRPDVAKARESAALQAAADSYRGERDKAQYLDDVQAKSKLLSAAAAEAMASLCLGKLISAHDATPANQSSDHIVDPLTVLRWIRGMFQTSQKMHHETARKALHALIKYNWNVGRLADEVLHQSFGEGEHFTLECSFFGVVADMISDGTINIPPAQLACLSLSKLGHPTTDVRLRAFQLAVWLFHDPADQLVVYSLLPAVGSAAPNVYRHAQQEMTNRLANLYPNLAMPFLTECSMRLGHLEAPRRRATLSILPPFLKVLELEADTSQLGPDEIAQDQQALSSLVYLVVRFSDDHLEDIQDIIVSFAGSGRSRNTTALVKFLFEQGAKRSPEFVQHAQQIIACLAATPAGDIIFEEVYGFVDPSDIATSAHAHVPATPSISLANLDALFTTSARTKPLSQGQMALLFAGELLPNRLGSPSLSNRLPTLLHVAFIHCDDPNTVLREQAQRVFFQVVRAWLCDLTNIQTADAADRVALWGAAEIKTTSLALQSDTSFWKADDHGSPETFFHAPAKMSTMVAKVLGVFQQLQPKLRQQWGALALDWATSCTIRHLACRSFQVFRILAPDVNSRMISDVLARLSSTIASPAPEIQSFNNEVMRTFSAIVQSLSPADMKSYPQIFWCSMACLTTPYESEFSEVVDLLSHVLDKTNLADPIVVADLVAFRPQDLKGPTAKAHLQPLLLIGLRSSKTDMLTFDVLRRLTSVPEAALIDAPSDRLLHGFVSALPWMLHSTDLGEPNEELAGMASDLADIAERQGNAGLARLLTSFARARFRTKDDFIRQAASHLRDHLGAHALEIVTLLLGFVLNQNDWMRDKALQMLKLILSFPEAKALAPHSRELVRPLLRLVSTKHATLALDILELPFAQPEASAAESGRQLFGPFEPSGWCIPNAPERSEVTRSNVSAVFNTCAVETRAASAHFSVLQFADVRAGANAMTETWGASQISLDLPSPPMSIPDNASMGDLVGALHSLNQFFDEGLDFAPAPSTSPLAARRVAPSHFARVSSTDSIGVARVMARGMMRSPSAAMSRDERSERSERSDPDMEGYSLGAGGLMSAEGFPTSSTDHATAVPRPGSSASQARHDAIFFQTPNGNGNGNTNGALGAAFNAYGAKRPGGLYVHAAHQPSFSSESEFGASDNVFNLDDSGHEAAFRHAQGFAASISHSYRSLDDDVFDAPVRPWNNNGSDRSRTPSPRDTQPH